MEQINQKFIYNVYSLYKPISNSRNHFCVSACYLCKEVNFHLFNANTHTRGGRRCYKLAIDISQPDYFICIEPCAEGAPKLSGRSGGS